MTKTALRRQTAPSSRPGMALVFGLLVAALTASCGGSPSLSPGAVDGSPTPSTPTAAPSAGSVGSVDACAILSAADIAEIVGATPSSIATSGGGWSAGDCAWNSAKGSFILSVGTAESIRAFGDPLAPDAKARLAQFRQEMSATGSPRDIDDIGDGAVLGTTGMAAYKADTYVEVLNLGITEKQLIKIVELAIEKA